MLPFAPGITGYYTEQDDIFSLELRSLRSLRTTTFVVKDQTIINTIKQGFSPILEDYLGDNIPGFSNVFYDMLNQKTPANGEEKELEIYPNTKVKFCWIPAGEVQLGSSKEEQKYIIENFYDGIPQEWMPGESEDARGIHTTNGFWMGKYPVIQSQWKAVMGNNQSHFNGDNLPVEQVNWFECKEFIKKCTALDLKLNLPHEDQWEYACRGGNVNKQMFYWGDTLNGDRANYDGRRPHTTSTGSYLGKTTEVGSYEKVAPHPWGLCDMVGNVYEWCDNLYDKVQSYRIIRGGSYISNFAFCRSSYRSKTDQMYHIDLLGFRLIIC